MYKSKSILVHGYIALLFLVLVSCARAYKLETRLAEFYSCLDTPTQTAFMQGNLDVVTTYIKDTLPNNPEKLAFFNQLKQREAIELFAPPQIVDYFYRYFYLKIEKTTPAN